MCVDDIFGVSGKKVIVTGGSSGIGLQLVKLFAQRGARVASVAVHHAGTTSEELSAAGLNGIEHVRADLSSPSGVIEAFAHIDTKFGTPDIIFNSAGISQRERFLDVTQESWDSLFDINLKAAFFVSQEAACRMVRDGVKGSIINLTSILAARSMTGTAVYSAAKAALTQLTKGQALELAPHGIRVNAIAPGWFETRMTSRFMNDNAKGFLKSVNPLKRLGQPGDIDGAALLLASDAGRYITGTVITIDGGHSLNG